MSSHTTRRQFLKSTAAATAAAPYIVPSAALGANGKQAASERITLGMIGMGKMAEGHLRNFLKNTDVQVVAVCDCYKMFKDKALDTAKKAYGKSDGSYKGVEGYDDFRDVIARDDIDAVLIATPDHWHAIPVIEAARAGKDIYCEKPLSLTIHQAREMANAVRRFDRVFQTGSQQRSSGNFRYACELVQSGYIGELKTIHVGIGSSSVECDLPVEEIPEGLNWDMWLGPAPYRPFNSILRPPHNKTFPRWRNYKDFSGGMMTDWGAHHFDIAQWGLGMDESGPVEINAPDGKDFETLTYRYANGVEMYHNEAHGVMPNGVLFTGTEGKIQVNRGRLESWPENIIKVPLKPNDVHLYKSPGHHQDWINCIKERRRPICDVEVGCRSVSVCHLGNIAYWSKQQNLQWDPKAEQFTNNDQANRMLSRGMREPWTL